MRATLNQSCFPGLSTVRFVEVAAAVGADAVELRLSGREEAPAPIAEAVRAAGMPVMAVNPLMDWALPDDPDPRPALEALLEVAVAVAAPLIVCVAPIRLESLPPHEVIIRSAIERLTGAAVIARQAGVRLALEQVGSSSSRPGATSGIRRLQDALGIVQEIAGDVVLVADSYNLATAGERYEQIREIPLPRLGIAHLADGDRERGVRVYPGAGNLDLDAFVRVLRESGYTGALSLEFFPTAPWPDPLAFAQRAIALVRGYVERSAA